MRHSRRASASACHSVLIATQVRARGVVGDITTLLWHHRGGPTTHLSDRDGTAIALCMLKVCTVSRHFMLLYRTHGAFTRRSLRLH